MAVLLKAIKYITFNQILDVLYFPFWWYTRGLAKVFASINQKRKDLSEALAIRILLANLFKPMFGQYDRPGRIISFFMRCFQLFIRLLLFFFGLIGLFILLIIWLGLPIFAFYQIINLVF